jgi:hypothetical protein
MKPHLILFATGLVVALFSCQTGNNETARHTEAKTDTSASVICYQYAANKDTIRLQMNQAGEKVSGTLLYSLYEKDRNQGIIAGTLKGDLLLADYTFQSEGMTSVRQVAFKRKGNGWVEGYGDIITKNDTVSFRNADSLRFDNTSELGEVACW